MTGLSVIASVPSKLVRFGGEQHSGWLPAHATLPASTQQRNVELTFEIQADGTGFLLCYSSTDGAISGDTWHASQAEAEKIAFEDFGVQFHEWLRA
jgi:hypothetical protein